MTNKKKRAVVEVQVDELHLVDDGANQKDFLLIKNKEGEKVSVEKAEEEKMSEEEKLYEGKEKMPEEEMKSAHEEMTKQAQVPTHEAMVREMLAVMAECGKALWEKSANLDITDDEMMGKYQEKIYDLKCLFWDLEKYAGVMKLANAATDAATKGDAMGAMDSVAKMVKTFGETALANLDEGEIAVAKMDMSTHPAVVKVQKMMLEQGQIARLVEGLVMVNEALAGVESDQLQAMLAALMGDGPPPASVMPGEEGETKGTEMKKGDFSDAEKAQLSEARAVIAKMQEQQKQMQVKIKKMENEVQPSNGLSADTNGQKVAVKRSVSWPSDFAARKSAN